MQAAIKKIVQAKYGASSPQMLTFGFQPVKVATKTVAIKVAAVDQGAATRKARHTMGKVARLAIKGVVAPPPTSAPPGAGVTQTGTPAPSAHAGTPSNGSGSGSGAAG